MLKTRAMAEVARSLIAFACIASSGARSLSVGPGLGLRHAVIQRSRIRSDASEPPAAAAVAAARAPLLRAPDHVREVIDALFDSEKSKRAFDRDMIAKRQAARDFPDELGNKFTCAHPRHVRRGAIGAARGTRGSRIRTPLPPPIL
jgi:hypothetical protein